jgi:hypothetical protein
MIAGRIVWGISAFLIYPLAGFTFNMEIFIASALLNAIPGIIFQLVFIPAFLQSLVKTNSIPQFE